ncbi:nuclear pore complex protein NUP205-like [Phalaenopsis equestris]|uniref:nuclear pore complex protein NUP205-like n=1 Tax=Phalaenopsis equestris TaxID=78828 RepID=UPI0009E1E9D5|nr:nuclear pore complex protein NUP205-like [Phalaenopsis equestris]
MVGVFATSPLICKLAIHLPVFVPSDLLMDLQWRAYLGATAYGKPLKVDSPMLAVSRLSVTCVLVERISLKQLPMRVSHLPSLLRRCNPILFPTSQFQRQPELVLGNEDLWSFVNFAGEDLANIPTLVAFLGMLKTLAATEEGASKVFELLQGKMFRRVGWGTLFDCLSIYDERFRQSMHSSSGSPLPDIQEGDAQALVAYLNVLQKVVENGDSTERTKWFPDIEPFFKLLSYENVPPYLKGALRNVISSFVGISPLLKDTIWSYLEKYDLPVVVGPPPKTSGLLFQSQIYDMRFELNEVEARRERYPSTISFINLLNSLISQERDVSDRGQRFVGIFRFVYDHVFSPFPQRAYADPKEKWQLVISCLQHFHLVLSMYDLRDEDINNAADMSLQLSCLLNSTHEVQLPVLELLKDFLGGKVVFRNVMGIILIGVNSLINARISQAYGNLLEKAIQLSLEIIVLVFERDLFLVECWRPLYQPLDIVLSQDHNYIVSLLEFVRYDFLPEIQLLSIKIASILSSRMAGLVQFLLKTNAAKYLIEDYAACLEARFDESVVVENTKDDPGVLIMQLLIDNIRKPAPNLTHLLLKFDVNGSVEKTLLQPKYHFSCLKVILDNLEKLLKPEINAPLHEFGFQLFYELCLDPLTSGPIVDLLSNKKYQFFSKHLESIGVAPLPKRTSNQSLRISTLHQRGWLLKLLALELHSADMAESSHRETCMAIISQTFGQCADVDYSEPYSSQTIETHASGFSPETKKMTALEFLEIIQFKPPDIALRYPQFFLDMKYHTQVEDILSNPSTSEMGGVYYYSERGDRLIDLDAFHDRLWQMLKVSAPQAISHLNEAEKGGMREATQQLLRWAWKHNKNLEEQAAQLHMLTGWSHIIEVSISRKMLFIKDHYQVLIELLDASLSASASPDCSLKMAMILSHVALTCMAKLRDERFLCPGDSDSDGVTCLDIVSVKQLPNGACHSILFKLMMAILRNESSEALRRRQYALLLIYFQYCRSILDPEIPASVLDFLLREEQGEDELNLQKIDKEQTDLARANFAILKDEAQAVIDVGWNGNRRKMGVLDLCTSQSLKIRERHDSGVPS